MICLEEVFFSCSVVRTSSTLVLILRFDKTAILFPFFVVFFLFVLTFFEDVISKVVAARQMYRTIEDIKPSRGGVLIFLNELLLVTSTLSQNIYLFLYMKSIACHIYHTFLKIPYTIFCIPHLFDFPCSIWLYLGIQKIFFFLDYQERSWDCVVMKCLLSLFHCLESSRNIQLSISNMKS